MAWTWVLLCLMLLVRVGALHQPGRWLGRSGCAALQQPYFRSSTALSFKTFDEMLAELSEPVLVDFYAQWCGPCRMMQPVLEDIAARMENDIKVAKVDTDRSPTLGNRYQVEALPTLILFSKGQVIDRYVGYMTADELEVAVKASLKRVKAAT